MERLSDADVSEIADWLTDELGDGVAGHPIRVDAGERGRIWIALPGAIGDDEAERALFDRADDCLSQVPDAVGPDVEFRISSGGSDDDLVFVCELYHSSEDDLSSL